MKRLRGFASLLLLGWLLVPPPLIAQQSTTLYVNRTDPTCGGQSPCFSTIQAAIDAAQPRTTIRIQAGVYAEQLTIEKSDFGGAVEADRIVIESDPTLQQEQVVLNGPGGSSCTNNFAVRMRRSNFVTLRGLTITGAGAQAIILMGGNNSNQGIHIELNRIFGNSLANNCNGGIEINAGNPGTIVANNLIYGNGGNAITVFGERGGPQYIVNNTICANQWNGIEVSVGQQVLLANNLINANGSATGKQGTRFGVLRQTASPPAPQNLQLRNNLICANTGGQLSGAILDTSDSGNFTPLGNEGPGVSALPGCDNPANLFSNRNGPDGVPNTIDDDFSLKEDSLAIDVGMDPRTLGLSPAFNSIFEADFRQDNIRPADGNADRVPAFDVSAFEYPNAPPIANAGANQTVYRGQLVTLNGSQSSDPEGAPLTYQWSIISQPAGSDIILTGANTVAPTFTPLFLGDYKFQLIVSDGQFSSAASIVRVTVINRGPTANAGGPYMGIVGIPVQFSGSGTDADGDPITFSWDFGDGSKGNGRTPAHTYATVSIYTVTLTVTDSVGASAVSQSSATIEGVSITNVEPPSGVIGTLVTITGNNFEPGATRVTFNGTSAVVRTITDTTITTTVPTSATTGPLTIRTSRGSASRNFTVTTSQDFNLTVNPSSVQSVKGGSTSILIDAIPSNGFSGLIQLATGSLPPGVVANVSPSTLAPNNHSVLALNTTSSTPTGAHAVEIRASSQLDGQSVTKTATVTLNIAAPGQTVLVGQVLDGDDRPLPNVSIKLGGTTLTHLGSSDAAGNLFIPLSVTGPQVFLIDGSPANTASINYPTIPVTIDIQATAINELGYVPRLRGHTVAKLISFVPGQATIITDPDLPGFKMTIPAGVRIIGWDGQPNSQFGVTTVPIDRSPLPPLVLPPGLEARQTYLFSFGKVGGGVPTGNISIDTPNNFGGLPGEKVDLYFFNEAPDGSAPNQWEKYGTATVSDDGTTLVTDINPATGLQYGIPRFCCGALTPVFNFINRLFGASGGPNDGGNKAGDPVDVSTGFFYVDKTDMVLPGRLPAVVTRTYRTNFTNPGPFGIGTSASFDISLQAPSIFNNETVVLISPGNKQDIFSRQPDGTYINATSPSLRGAVLTQTGPQEPAFSLRFKDGMIWRFNSSGTLANQGDRNGNSISFSRDSFNRVVRIREPTGRELILNYGNPGLGLTNIQSITDPIGRQVRYTYDALGRLETVTDPAGGVTRYTYDSADRMLTLRDPRGITFLINEYDANGRVVRQTQADGGVWTFEYTSNGTYVSQSVVTNPRGHATTYRFNAAGYLTSETDALGMTTTFERQIERNLTISITDSLRRVTRFQYDATGNVTGITDPVGNSRTFAYNSSFNRVARMTDPLGNITRFDYDASGNLIAIIDPLGNRTTFTYNAFGQPTSTTDPLGNIATLTYDDTGNLASITDPLGNTSQRTYDLVSRPTARSDPRGKIAKYVYDALNRLTSITDPAGGVTRFLYDDNGNLVEFTDARGNTVVHSYDSMDRLATRTDPLGAVETLQFDGMGNVTRHTDRKGQVAILAYDSLNRHIRADFADGTSTGYVYDSYGRLMSAKDSVDGSIANQYDSLDRLVSQITKLGTVSYQYDALNRRTRTDIPGRIPVTYSYDAASRLTQIVQGTEAVDLAYDTSGRRTRMALPNGVSTEYQYDAASRLTALIYHRGLSLLGDLTYQYDRASNRAGVGGSFARALLPNSVSSATYDAANRQLQFGNKQMSFDANGNLSSTTDSIGTTLFSWDARNRLMATSGTGTTAGFVYDVFGRRSEARVNSQRVQYQYDGLNPIQETADGGTSANFLTGPGIDEYLVRTDVPSGSKQYFLADALGSSVALTDDFAVVQTEYTYEPFGKTAVAGGLTFNPFQYTGRELDGTGLHYYRARYYDSETQRFIAEDPLGIAAGDPNLFVYTKNNPTNFRDPTGQFVPQAVVAGALCAVGAVAGSYTYQQLAGRKTSFAGFLGSAAAGCVGGLGLGWGIGIALEAVIPSIMVGGGQVALWGGIGIAGGRQLATAKAAEIGAATIYQTFTGSALSLVEAAIPNTMTQPLWSALSGSFVSSAGSATVLIGRQLTSTSVFMTNELPVLLQNRAVLEFIFY